MADVALPSLTELSNTFGDWNPNTYVQAQNQYDLAKQFANTSLADEQRKLQYNQQMDPLRVQQQQLQNTGLDNQNQESGIKVQGLQRDWQNRQSVPQDMEQKMLRSKLLKETSDADLDQAQSHIQQMALSNDPNERAQALAAMQQFKEFVKQRAQLQSAENIAKTREETSRYVADQSYNRGVDSAEIRANKPSGAPADFETLLTKLGTAAKQQAALINRAEKARGDGDDALAQRYQARADALDPSVRRELSSAGASQSSIITGPDGRRTIVNTPRAANVPPVIGGNNDRPTPQNLLSKLPQGSKDNGDGTFTLPSGKIVKPKGQ